MYASVQELPEAAGPAPVRETQPSRPVPSPETRRIRQLAEQRLHDTAYPALRMVSCEFEGGVLTLRGRLPTFFLRQMAQKAVAGMEGVRTIVDRIEVVRPARREGGPEKQLS